MKTKARQPREVRPGSTREPQRRQIALSAARTLKMARSAHAYVRGNTARFYEWLASVGPSTLPEGPPVWICGDCHIGNLGPVANVAGRLDVNIRDFDQTVIGNPAHDLIRLGLSLASAARGSDLPGVTTARMIEHMVVSYTDAFAPHKTAAASLAVPDVVKASLATARQRTWKHLAAERLAGETMAIPLGKRFWPVSAAERERVRAFAESPEITQLLTQLHYRDDHAKVKFLDTAYWMKGCSSLGRLRFAVLLDVGQGVAKGRDFCLLDIKEATRAVAPRAAECSMPDDDGLRVLQGARAMSPFLGERMATGRLMRRSVFAREMLPQDLKLEIDQLSVEEATRAAYFLARTVGGAHARQMDSGTRKTWRRELTHSHSKVMDAPP